MSRPHHQSHGPEFANARRYCRALKHRANEGARRFTNAAPRKHPHPLTSPHDVVPLYPTKTSVRLCVRATSCDRCSGGEGRELTVSVAEQRLGESRGGRLCCPPPPGGHLTSQQVEPAPQLQQPRETAQSHLSAHRTCSRRQFLADPALLPAVQHQLQLSDYRGACQTFGRQRDCCGGDTLLTLS